MPEWEASGGVHVQALARLGIGALDLTDFDQFELANFNRQAGATMSSLGQPKVEVMRQHALDVNPEMDIRVFPDGLNESNLAEYLDGASVLVDAIDFFANDIRPLMYEAARKKGIPVVCSAPLGAGASLITFFPEGMRFEDYFGFAGADDVLRAVRFLVGMSPRLPQRHYLAYPEIVSFVTRRVPSLGMACQFTAGMAATAAMKIVLRPGWGQGRTSQLPVRCLPGAPLSFWRPGGLS